MDGVTNKPDCMVSVRERFGFDSDLMVPAFGTRDDHVPDIDDAYRFNPDVTLAILAGFARNRRVLVQGMHGTGKSTHIEQVAARLNWPCVRVNLDGHISRLDLVGKDAIVVRDDVQVTEFQEGIVPWALQRPVALIFDEYDAGRPDVMFVIQRILERDGKFTLLDQNRVIHPHPSFRLFATANTVGLGNLNGLYHGTQMLNHAQMDRWNVVATLDYLPRDEEIGIVRARVPELADEAGRPLLESMVSLAELTRNGFATGDLSTLMSPRTVINWAENCQIFRDPALAFRLTFLNKCDDAERPVVAEYWLLRYSSVIPRPYVVVDGAPPAVLRYNDTDDELRYVESLPADAQNNSTGNAPPVAARPDASRALPSVKREQPLPGMLDLRGVELALP
ncbi:AAA family ATPase, partial [Burkholderia sp. Se-20378]|uniref:AAA family ATPase n=1 Tax=Burkholderia sp. Se-20378 TaxID=2703899 RepID=UPI001EC3C377